VKEMKNERSNQSFTVECSELESVCLKIKGSRYKFLREKRLDELRIDEFVEVLCTLLFGDTDDTTKDQTQDRKDS